MGVWSIIVPLRTELTNLVANPSFETNTTGYTAIGGSIAASAAAARYGNLGLLVSNIVGNNDGVYFGTVALTDGVTYTLGVDFKSTVDDRSYKIYFADTSGNIKGTATVFTGSSVYWQRQYVTWECDATASYRIYIIKNGFAGAGTFHIDGLSVVATAYELTYFDGDTPNARWTGAAHGSASVLSAQARNAGRVIDLEDYNLLVHAVDGAGMITAVHQVTQAANVPGAFYRGSKPQPRSFILTSTVYGTDLADLHSKRKAIVYLLKHWLVAGDQPVILRYNGANPNAPVEISCYIDQEAGKLDFPTAQRLAIRLVAYDPYFYDIGDKSQLIPAADSKTLRYFAARRNGSWTAITPSAVTDPGSGILVRDIEIAGNYVTRRPAGLEPPFVGETTNERIYVTGSFLNWNGSGDLDYICYYNPVTAAWATLEAGTNGYVRKISIAPNGYVYVCGEFTQIGSVAANRVAYWDGAAWQAMGSGGNAAVYDILVGIDGKVYVTGAATDIGGVAAADYVAYWDGSWHAMASGLSATGYSLAQDQAGNVYVGGTQTGAVSKWNGSSWTALTPGSTAFVVKCDAAGNVYAGMNGSEYIKKWNGQAWESLGGGVSGGAGVQAIDIDANGLVWVGGDFDNAGGLGVRGLACWNGYSWVYPDIQLPALSIVYAIKCNGPDIYIGFDQAGTADISYHSTVTNAGTARAFPYIVISRTAGDSANVRYLRNETTGATIYLDYDLQTGETLTIDFDELNKGIVSSRNGAVWRAVLRGSNFSDFYLVPGDNLISLFVYATGAWTLPCYLNYKPRYDSIDGAAA